MVLGEVKERSYRVLERRTVSEQCLAFGALLSGAMGFEWVWVYFEVDIMERPAASDPTDVHVPQ